MKDKKPIGLIILVVVILFIVAVTLINQGFF